MNGTIEQPETARRQWLALVVILFLCFGTAAAGAAFTSAGLESWYGTLKKPSWSPPNSVFGPVWTVLYAMMAVAAWLVWKCRNRPQAWQGLRLFAVQLVLNLGWSIVFFTLRSPGLAFFEILVLWTAIVATTVLFWRTRPSAAVLMIPYLLWVTFAAALNGTIASLNP
jgi:tryptophan-rich sensory protein